jgi:endonuclease-3
VRRVRDRLREVYGIPRTAPHGRPLDELVLTVLSQSTNDRNRDVAFLRLRERFAASRAGESASRGKRGSRKVVGAGGRGGPPSGDPGDPPSGIDYAAVLAAPVAEVEEAIRPGGISKVKSARIQAILAAIAASPHPAAGSRRRPAGGATSDDRAAGPAEHGGSGDERGGRDSLSLEWMRDAPVPESRAYLCALPGVGRKTAACVLLFSYGLRDVPVDTHVSRVGTRLALLRAGAPFEELHDQMLALTPPGGELELHVNLLRHGRRTCYARRPACEDCALARMCPSRGLFD